MTDRNSILKRLDDDRGSPQIRRLRGLLKREDTRIVSNRSSKVSVSEALRLWKTRLKNTDVTGLHLDGARSLVTRLESLTPQRKLEQFALVAGDTSGNVFFDGSTRHFVGAIIVEKK
jgi:hypothetical protein